MAEESHLAPETKAYIGRSVTSEPCQVLKRDIRRFAHAIGDANPLWGDEEFAKATPFGSPIALFEMMGSGLAVIAPAVAPVQDGVEEGQTGLIVPAGDVQKLAEALIWFKSNPERTSEFGLKARERVFRELQFSL